MRQLVTLSLNMKNPNNSLPFIFDDLTINMINALYAKKKIEVEK
jgi:hypothetical protein